MKYLVGILLILGGLGGLMFGAHPLIGALLCFLGVGASIWETWKTNADKKETEEQLERISCLLATHGLGNIYMEQFQREIAGGGLGRGRAFAILEQAIRANPNDLDALAWLASINALLLSFYQWAGQDIHNARLEPMLMKVKNCIEHGLLLAPEKHAFWDIQGILLDLEGNHTEAQKAFLKAGSKRGDPYWRLYLAVSLAMSGDRNAALEEMKQARADGATGWMTDFYLGRALLDTGFIEEAQQRLTAAVKMRGWRPELLSCLGRAAHLRGRFFTEAKYDLEEGISLIPLAPRAAARSIGKCLVHIVLGTLMAVSHLLWPVTKHIPVVCWLHVHLIAPDEPEATLVFSIIPTGNKELALSYFQTAFGKLPSPKNTANLAGCYAMLGNSEKGLAICSEGLARYPGDELITRMKIQIERSPPGTKRQWLKMGPNGEIEGTLLEDD